MSPRIDPERISRRIEALSGFTEPGRPWTRTAFSPHYEEAREWLRQEMQSAGLSTEIDAGGNLIGRLPGKRNDLGSLGLGSHIDTVPDGGRFDGIAGVVAALEVAQAINEAGLHLQHPLAIFDFLAEEPNRFGLSCVGSRAIAGELSADTLQVKSPEGETLAEGIGRMGGCPEKLTRRLLEPESVRAFMELHIEQGTRLESAGDDIGIVTDIVGISRAEITFAGRADHSGTTPMGKRQDALGGWTEGRNLAEALRSAGGVRPDADLSAVEIRRGGRVFVLDLREVITGRDKADMMLLTGDEVFVPSRQCFQDDLMVPSPISPTGISLFLSNLTQPATGNAISAIGRAVR